MIATMDETTRQLAIIGPTASGKSALAVKIAKQTNALILSLDSLCVYKEIDIVSAKPTVKEQEGIHHYGIDVILPSDPFDVTLFAKLYRDACCGAKEQGKNLIIVGGTGFYLKSLMDGISTLPPIDPSVAKKVSEAMLNLNDAYHMLCSLDPSHMRRIALGDTYRIQKTLEIFYATKQRPSAYLARNPPLPVIQEKLPLYRIVTEKSLLHSYISKRTAQMLKNSLIDEVATLEGKYTRIPNCMKAIGIKETLDYLDGAYSKKILEEKITTNTARLAKRQTTFNQSQFGNHLSLDLKSLEKRILSEMRQKS